MQKQQRSNGLKKSRMMTKAKADPGKHAEARYIISVELCFHLAADPALKALV